MNKQVFLIQFLLNLVENKLFICLFITFVRYMVPWECVSLFLRNLVPDAAPRAPPASEPVPLAAKRAPQAAPTSAQEVTLHHRSEAADTGPRQP